MDLLLTKTPPEEIKNCVLPMVYRALEAPSVQIQVQFIVASVGLVFQKQYLTLKSENTYSHLDGAQSFVVF